MNGAMDEDLATQPATQPYIDLRRVGRSNELNPEDASDIILILHPTTPAAISATQVVKSRAAQHILQNMGLSRANLNTAATDDGDMNSQHMPAELTEKVTQGYRAQMAPVNYQNESLDFALRFSSKILDMNMGWTFGRRNETCDILLQDPDVKIPVRISGTHFRIYITDAGIIMLEDVSTNGTTVDGFALKRDTPNVRRILAHGSHISIVVTTDSATKHVSYANFIVRIPERDSVEQANYAKNLELWMDKRERSALPQRYSHLRNMIRDPPHAHQFTKPSSRNLLSLGTSRYNHGMRWNGGNKYSVIDCIGKGAFATVYKLVDRGTGDVYAAKEIDKMKFMKNGQLDNKLGNELLIIKKLTHPHIIKYHDYQDTHENLYIMMEYIEYGDMLNLLGKVGPIEEKLGQSIARQLSHALAYMHDEGVAHRDIKPDNILIARPEPIVVKLTDFGLSKIAEGSSGGAMNTFCGTLLYCAPEVYPDYGRFRAELANERTRASDQFRGKGFKRSTAYSRKVDLWSLAAVMFHLLTNHAPFNGTAENHGQVMLRTILSHPLDIYPLTAKGVSPACISFITSGMRVDPTDRPTAAELLNFEWLKVDDVQEIPLTRSQLADDHYEDNWDYESDFEDTGYSSRVNELSSQRVTGQNWDIMEAKLDPIPEAVDSRPESLLDGYAPATQLPSRPRDPHGPRLFGEVAVPGLVDSDIFPTGQRPIITTAEEAPADSSDEINVASRSHSRLDPSLDAAFMSLERQLMENDNGQTRQITPLLEANDSQGLQNTTSQLNNLDIEADKENNDVMGLKYDRLPSPSPAMSGFKRVRQSNEEHPEIKASMSVSKKIMLDDHENGSAAVSVVPFASSLALENTSDDDILARLNPLPGSFDSTPIIMKDRLCVWGRSPKATHRYHDPLDTRVPKLGMDILFWGRGIEELIEAEGDWQTMPQVHALIMTRASRGISVNGVHLKKAGDDDKFLLCGKLQTGDRIEVYNEGGQYLSYFCEIFAGNSARLRSSDDVFEVEGNEDLWRISHNWTKGKH